MEIEYILVPLVVIAIIVTIITIYVKYKNNKVLERQKYNNETKDDYKEYLLKAIIIRLNILIFLIILPLIWKIVKVIFFTQALDEITKIP